MRIIVQQFNDTVEFVKQWRMERSQQMMKNLKHIKYCKQVVRCKYIKTGSI